MASARKKLRSADWAELPSDLLTLIAKRIDFYEDFSAFGGVCTSWRSIAVKENFNHLAWSSVQIPWLILAEEEEEEGNTHLRGFASLIKNGMVRKVELPETRGKRCIGSLGWLITIDTKGGDLELLHPLSRVRIPLPHLRTYKYYKEDVMSNYFCIRRAVLSASPSFTHDYVVMIITAQTAHNYPTYPAFWRPGDTMWTVIEPPSESTALHYLDVMFYKDKFYAINTDSELVCCQVDGPDCGNGKVIGRTSKYVSSSYGQPYLIASTDGELLVVSRNYDGDLLVVSRKYDAWDSVRTYWRSSFRVFRFYTGFEDNEPWLGRSDLGGGSVFVGHSATTFIPPSAVAATGRIRRNCIYFTDDISESYCKEDFFHLGGSDMGIYDLETGKVERLPLVKKKLTRYCPPIWMAQQRGQSRGSYDLIELRKDLWRKASFLDASD